MRDADEAREAGSVVSLNESETQMNPILFLVVAVLSLVRPDQVCEFDPGSYGPASEWRQYVQTQHPNCPNGHHEDMLCEDLARAEALNDIAKIEMAYRVAVCACIRNFDDPIDLFQCLLDAANAADWKWALLKHVFLGSLDACCEMDP